MLKPGDLILLVGPQGNHYLRRFDPDDVMHTQEGVMHMSDVSEAGFGGAVQTHKGRVFRILRPTTYDLIKGVKRATQIMYPKEIGYTLLRLGVRPGSRVIESGSGSGGLTLALAQAVGDTGRVYTFERRKDFYALCGKNLAAAGLEGRVTRFNKNIDTGFTPDDADITGEDADPSGAEALFLDVRTPWDYLEQVTAVIEPGAPLGFLLPTTNQVCDLLEGLESGPFEDAEVLEIMLRRWKPNFERLRPDDRMVAHTGFLVFARHKGSEALPAKPLEERPERQGE